MTCLAESRCRSGELPADGLALCRACLDHAAASVPLLVHDYRDLEQLLPRPISVWHDGQPRGGGEPHVPLQLHVEALQAEIWWLTTAWAEVLADVQRLADPPRRVRSGFAVQWAVRILATRSEALCRLGMVEVWSYPAIEGFGPSAASRTGAQGLLDLTQAHHRARTVLGLTDPVYALPGRCQNRGCGRAELRVRDGSDTVWCDHCGTSMTRDDYDRLGNLFRTPKETAA